MDKCSIPYFLDKNFKVTEFNFQNYQLEYFLPREMVEAILKAQPFPSKKRFLGLLKTLDFLEYIYEKCFERGQYTSTPIHVKVWRQFFSSKVTLGFKQMLKERNIVVETSNKYCELLYSPGVTSIHYLLHPKWHNVSRDWIYVDVGRNKVDFVRKDIQFFENYDLIEDEAEANALFDLAPVVLNEEAALEAEYAYYIKEKGSFQAYQHRVASIRRFNLQPNTIRKGVKGHRFYHKVSNLSCVTREHLYNRQNGKAYMYLDVKNCQPLLLIAVLRSKNLGVDNNYQYFCEKGVFYEAFQDLYLTRQEVKQACYKNIFFSQEPNSKIFKRFQELFPITCESLLTLCSEQISLAAELQKMESSIFNTIEGRDCSKDRHFVILP